MLTFRAIPNPDRDAMRRYLLGLPPLDRTEPPASHPSASLPSRAHSTVIPKPIGDDTADLPDPKRPR